MSATLTFSDIKNAMIVMPLCDDVQMSNSNTRVVLSALGLSPNFDGSDSSNPDLGTLDIADFEIALGLYLNSDIASIIDGGKAPSEVHCPIFNMTAIDCGRREGYIIEKVTAMLATTRKARLMGAVRCYFA